MSVMPAESFQQQFHRRWQHLTDPHVRALAWLLDSPNLLDCHAPQWQGQIASLPDPAEGVIGDWLCELDRKPQALHAALDLQPFTRLGRYAERLMVFYFEYRRMLVAHGVQVRADKSGTIGEFDFLLRQGQALLHWELATKFYLLEPSGTGLAADYFVGPNLADTLGAKMHKIFDQQLKLAQHPAAGAYLPQSVAQAQALVKGWLFYPEQASNPLLVPGVAPEHCRGFWCEFAQVTQLSGELALILPRLSWLAPARVQVEEAIDLPALQVVLAAHFAKERVPVLVAILERHGNVAIEVDRGFIVPDDWRERAGQRIRRPGLTGV